MCFTVIWARQYCGQDWSAHMTLKNTLEGNTAIIQPIPTQIKCIIEIYPCWWTFWFQILKVFASVRHISMETHGVWLIPETKSNPWISSCTFYFFFSSSDSYYVAMEMDTILPQTWWSNILSNESGKLSWWFENGLNVLLTNQIAWPELLVV